MKRLFCFLIFGHLLGACYTYVYLHFILLNPSSQIPAAYKLASFVLGTGLLGTSFFLLRRKSVGLLTRISTGTEKIQDLEPDLADYARRQALQFPAVITGISFVVWVAAGGLFGFVDPLVAARLFDLPSPDLLLCLKHFLGITLLGGGVTCLILFFVVDMVWRQYIPLFFPEGRLRQVKYGFRLNLRIRFLMVFLGIVLIPMPMVGLIIFPNINQIHMADALTRGEMIRSLYWELGFVTVDLLTIACVLAYLFSKSIISPLEEIKDTVRAVEKQDLSRQVPVRSNDELGDVAQGVNAMVRSLDASQRASDTLGRFMCREIREQVLAEGCELTGEMKRVTLLFSDLRGFTGLVEQHHPKAVVSIMNRYFDEMTQAVGAHKGLILQYVGDEIEAVFGAPVGFEDHPEMAVQAALSMRQRLKALNETLAAEGKPALAHGIGIHSGAVLAGNIGSRDRMTYALVGDTVNTASRIEGLTKTYGTDIILSQTTLNLLTGSYRTEELPPVQVRGKERQIILYKLLS